MNKNIKTLLVYITFIFISTICYAQHDKYFFQLLEGRAVLSRTSGATWLSLSQARTFEVAPGDMIHLEGNGRGELRYPDGSVARLKKQAMITLQRYGMNLRLGYVWMNVRRSSDTFKINTPFGSCSVLGTSFEVDVDRFGKSQIQVIEGIVAVRADSDTRNRQLVLQAGMKTTLNENTKVSDKPEKFSVASIEPALKSEWSARQFTNATSEAMQTQEEVRNTKIAPGLPPMRGEVMSADNLPAVSNIFDDLNEEKQESEKIRIIARQRSDFLEMLREQQLKRDSIIGGSFDPKTKAEMQIDQHNVTLGLSHKPNSTVSDHESLDREYYNLRNRLLRVQSQIRQNEQQISILIVQNITTASQKRKIASLQSELADLQSEHRIISIQLRDFQRKK